MMMKLYGVARSPFASRVTLVLRIKGLDFEMLPPPGESSKSPEYLALNPIGKIPCLDDAGTIVPESETICEYLEHAYPEPALLPADPALRARSRLINRVCDLYIMGPMFGLFPHLNPKQRDMDVAQPLLDQVYQGIDLLEHYLGDGYANGDSLSIADCAVVPVQFFINFVCPAFGDATPYASRPKLAAYWEGAQKNPMTAALLGEMAEDLKTVTG